MNKFLAILSGVTILVTCALITNATEFGEENKLVRKKVNKQGAILTATLAKTFVAGQEMPIRIEIQNDRKSSLDYFLRLGTGHYEFVELILTDKNGVEQAQTRFGKRVNDSLRDGSRKLVTIQPGKKDEFQLNLARVFDLSESGEFNLTIRCVLRDVEKSASEELKITDIPVSITEEPRR